MESSVAGEELAVRAACAPRTTLREWLLDVEKCDAHDL